MELQSPTTLVLCGKSAAENELARCLKSSNRLKLPDGSPVHVVLNSEMECRDRTENEGNGDHPAVEWLRPCLPSHPRVSIFKMELQSPTTLVLCGKSAAENELARCLKSSNRLKLPDGSPVHVVLNSEMECRDRTENEGNFCVRSYMSSLSTSRCGRLLVYSPKLAFHA